MVRLNTNLLQPLPQLLCNSTSVSHVTIALLNVRSLVAKFADVKGDNSLISASIQCFCETWLNASQPTPVLKHNLIDIRCDRVTCENKGGVLIYVPSQMHPSNIHKFATNDIEAVSVTLELCNGSHLQLALLYRSPSVSLATLTTMLQRLLRHLSVRNTPCVVLGDFNENVLHQENSTLQRFMSDQGFTLLVKSPTTTQGTLIDHVYYRNPSSNVVLEVHDTYYSDHDTVYCSIPFSEI